MCEFQNGTWGCRGDGYLWDADSDGWDPKDVDYPCPRCSTRQYLLDAKEEAESCSEGSNNGMPFTGESMWLDAVRYAEFINLAASRSALNELRMVRPLRPAANADGFESVTYHYRYDPFVTIAKWAPEERH